MPRSVTSALALTLALTAGSATASTPNQGPRPWDPAPDAGASPTAVTNHLKLVILGVGEDRVLRVWDESTDSEHFIRLAERVDIKPRRKKDFKGRSDLDFEDLVVGHRLKLTYRTADGAILRAKVLEKIDRLPKKTGDG
jgi:hypothetical protein